MEGIRQVASPLTRWCLQPWPVPRRCELSGLAVAGMGEHDAWSSRRVTPCFGMESPGEPPTRPFRSPQGDGASASPEMGGSPHDSPGNRPSRARMRGFSTQTSARLDLSRMTRSLTSGRGRSRAPRSRVAPQGVTARSTPEQSAHAVGAARRWRTGERVRETRRDVNPTMRATSWGSASFLNSIRPNASRLDVAHALHGVCAHRVSVEWVESGSSPQGSARMSASRRSERRDDTRETTWDVRDRSTTAGSSRPKGEECRRPRAARPGRRTVATRSKVAPANSSVTERASISAS